MDLRLPILRFLTKSKIAPRLREVRRQAESSTPYLHHMGDSVLAGPGEELRALKGLIEDSTTRKKDFIDLSMGTPLSRIFSEEEIAQARRQISNEKLYPPPLGLPQLREQMAQVFGEQALTTYNPEEEVIITNGVSQAISLAVDTFVNPGDRVVLLDPSFLVYNFCLKMQRARPIWVASQTRQGEILVDFDQLSRAMRRARMIFINSPANPTGCQLSKKSMEKIVELANHHDVLIFSDEVYDKFIYSGEFISPTTLQASRSRTLVAKSFSKTYGMVAYRVGVLAGPAGLIRPISMQMSVRCPFVPLICHALALQVLGEPREKFDAELACFKSKRDAVFALAQDLGIRVTNPSGAFYLWINISGSGLSADEFTSAIKQKGALVMPGTSFGPSGKRFIRISIAEDLENIKYAMVKIHEQLTA